MSSRKSTVLVSCLFATIGFVIQLVIVLATGFAARLDFVEHVATSVVGLLLSAAILGYLSHGYFSRKSNRTRAIILGASIGWVALWAQVLFGSSVEYFRHLHENFAFGNYVVKPTFWVIFIGTIPSLVIGGIFGNTAWRKLHKELP